MATPEQIDKAIVRRALGVTDTELSAEYELSELLKAHEDKGGFEGSGGGGGAVTSVNGAVGIVVLDAADVAADPTGSAAAALISAGELDQALTARLMFGERLGQALSPAALPGVLGPELWTLPNLDARGQQVTLSPSLTANGTNQANNTFIYLGNMANADTTYRLEFDYVNTVPSGWAGITLSLTDAAQVLIGGTLEQAVTGVGSPAGTKNGRLTFDFRPPSAGGTYLRVRLETVNNAPSGTISISNVTFKQTADLATPMWVAETHLNAGSVSLFWQHKDPATNTFKIAENTWAVDGNLDYAFKLASGTVTDFVWAAQINPYFGLPGGTEASAPGVPFGSTTSYSLRSNNNDQIFEVDQGAGFELRGNTHNGERLRASGVTWGMDKGDGAFVPWVKQPGATSIRRFQVSLPTYVCRSTDPQTEAEAFANVDHTFTAFPDGMVRCDRTTTFLKNCTLRNHFEWMSSFATNVGYIGRLGRGQLVHGEIDTRQKLAVPGVPTVTPSEAGGVLAAGTYSYRIAALSEYGETTVGTAATGVIAGATGSIGLSWSAVANASGYAIYGRTAAAGTAAIKERLLAKTTQLTWTDDGTVVPTSAPKGKNTAAIYSTLIDTQAIHSDDVTWAAFYEARSGWVIGNIYDRDALAQRPGVDKVRTRLEGAVGNIQKNYANLFWENSLTLAVTPGTVWTATHYAFIYLPENIDRFHTEIAARAASLSALADMYPIT